jgi:hypothetical protein
MKILKIIIAGSRDFTDREFLFKTMNSITLKLDKVIVVLGGARGADKLGEEWADASGFTREIYYPDYEKYGSTRAPLMRNEEMAQNADVLVAFHKNNSSGTAHMIQMARKYGLEVRVFKVS